MRMKCVWPLCLSIIVSIPLTVFADTSESYFVQLKGDSSSATNAKILQQEAQIADRWDTVDQAMTLKGYVTSTNEELASNLWILNELESLRSLEEVEAHLGFTSAIKSGSPFNAGHLLGVDADTWSDGKIHELYFVYEFADLGTVILREFSFGSAPIDSYRVSRALGNVSVNGRPASYLVLRDENGENGQTTIRFYTDDKAFHITALSEVPRSDRANFNRLMTLVRSLY